VTDFTYESSRIKEKYHDKVASENAIMDTWWRLIDITDLFAEYAWLQITAFDLSQLGIGLLLSILPYEFKPYSIEFEYSMPSLDEVMQGIWANFEKIVYELEYTWTSNWKEFIETNFKPEFWKDLEKLTQRKARYGYSTFSGYIYDPVLPREYLTETYHKMRLIRTPDVTWKATVQQIGETVAISDHVTRTSILRLSLISIAQTESFCLGLSVLGRSTLRGTPSEGATIPYVTPENELVELKYYTLDNLQMGFILGVTELGYAVLTPQTSTYSQKDGKENPNIVQHEVKKVRKAVDTLTLSTWAYCYDENTEVLTREGFKKFSELSYNDEIATLNPETDEIEYQHPIAIYKFNYKGKMVYINGRSIDLLVTPEHKLYCTNFYRERKGKNEGYNFIEAISLLQSYKYQKYKFKRTAKWKGVNIEYFELPNYEKNWVTRGAYRVFKEDKKLIPIVDWLKLFAWYIAEGDTSTHGKVRIANTNEKNLQEILELCEKLGFNASIYGNSAKGFEKAGIKIYSVQLWKYLSQFGKATEKFIPNWVKMLPPDKLQIFLETITKGDGHKDSKNWKYYTSSKRLADDIQEIAIKAGYTASVGETDDTRYGRNIHRYIVHIDRERKDVALTQKPSLIDYNGFVYDVTVPKHHIILVRRNGKICWSSNSNYNKPEEMLDYHRSDKTAQYDIIQSQRKFIEEWVRNQIPSSEANPVTVRQYQNAVLQAITWKAKRHKWGFKPFKDTPEDTFKSWWLTHWTSQGLKQPTLENLYSRLENIIPTIRSTKWTLGEQVKKIRRMRSGTLYI
jgi:intein/homing endonuclease